MPRIYQPPLPAMEAVDIVNLHAGPEKDALRNINIEYGPHNLVAVTYRGPENQLIKAVTGEHYNTHGISDRADVSMLFDHAYQFFGSVLPGHAVHLTEGSVPDVTPDTDPFVASHYYMDTKAGVVSIANQFGVQSQKADGEDDPRAFQLLELDAPNATAA